MNTAWEAFHSFLVKKIDTLEVIDVIKIILV